MATSTERIDPDVEHIYCYSCDTYIQRSLLDDGQCPQCETELLRRVMPSPGSTVERLLRRHQAADTTERQDIISTFAHLIACGVISPSDYYDFSEGRITDNLTSALRDIIDNAEEVENGEVPVCPMCESRIYSWKKWYIPNDKGGEAEIITAHI